MNFFTIICTSTYSTEDILSINNNMLNNLCLYSCLDINILYELSTYKVLKLK